MIVPLLRETEPLLERLQKVDDPFAVKIFADYRSYGTAYPFCRFFHWRQGEESGLLSVVYGEGYAYFCTPVHDLTEWGSFVSTYPGLQTLLFPAVKDPRLSVPAFTSVYLKTKITAETGAVCSSLREGNYAAGFSLLQKADDVFSLCPFDAFYADMHHRHRRGLATMLTYEREGRAVSTGMIIAQNGTARLLGQLATHPNWRQRGYARKVIRGLLSLPGPNNSYVFARRKALQEFYEKCGFTTMGAFQMATWKGRQ